MIKERLDFREQRKIALVYKKYLNQLIFEADADSPEGFSDYLRGLTLVTYATLIAELNLGKFSPLAQLLKILTYFDPKFIDLDQDIDHQELTNRLHEILEKNRLHGNTNPTPRVQLLNRKITKIDSRLERYYPSSPISFFSTIDIAELGTINPESFRTESLRRWENLDGLYEKLNQSTRFGVATADYELLAFRLDQVVQNIIKRIKSFRSDSIHATMSLYLVGEIADNVARIVYYSNLLQLMGNPIDTRLISATIHDLELVVKEKLSNENIYQLRTLLQEKNLHSERELTAMINSNAETVIRNLASGAVSTIMMNTL